MTERLLLVCCCGAIAAGAIAPHPALRGEVTNEAWVDPRSFPSGHGSSIFATALVLQQHYGWKLRAPLSVAGGGGALIEVGRPREPS